jgi:hypothetical protein
VLAVAAAADALAAADDAKGDKPETVELCAAAAPIYNTKRAKLLMVMMIVRSPLCAAFINVRLHTIERWSVSTRR